MQPVKKEYVWTFYVVMIIVLAMVGYFAGKASNKSEMYASAGVIVGAIVSVVLWMTWGKKNTV